jgi:hypothetical protein
MSAADKEAFLQVVQACCSAGEHQKEAEHKFNEARKNNPGFVAKTLVEIIGTPAADTQIRVFSCVLARRLCIHDGIHDVVMKKLSLEEQTFVATQMLELYKREQETLVLKQLGGTLVAMAQFLMLEKTDDEGLSKYNENKFPQFLALVLEGCQNKDNLDRRLNALEILGELVSVYRETLLKETVSVQGLLEQCFGDESPEGRGKAI